MMDVAAWFALGLFAFVSSITPGPNNLMATSSGARFGLRGTLPQVAGVTGGFTILLVLTASGLSAALVDHPIVGVVLGVCGYGYLTWLSSKLLFAAWHPPRSTPPIGGDRPLTFWQSVLFQFANPKAWMMALSAAGSLMHDGAVSIRSVAGLGILFAAINFPCVGAWAALGSRMQTWLQDPRSKWRPRVFDGSMGATLLATTVWMIAVR